MHLLESSLFRDVIVACGKEEDQCYVRNDGIDTIYATVSMESWSFREIHPKSLYTFTISLEAGNICK